MADLTKLLGGIAFTVPPREQPKRFDPPEVQLVDAIQAAGLQPPERIVMDGRIHRFKAHQSERGTSKNGWYVCYPDGVPAGRFGDWRTGLDASWRADVAREFSAAEEADFQQRMAQAAAQRDAERERTRQQASEVVDAIWATCAAAPDDHPYLLRKGVQAHGARVTGDGQRLVLPLYTGDGELASLQYISADGSKMYHPGGRVDCCFSVVGEMVAGAALYFTEGFASAASVYESTGAACVVTYSANNLPKVVGHWRERLGVAADLVVVADNDHSGTGQQKAAECAKQHGAHVVMPPEAGQDINDFDQAGGDVTALVTAPVTAKVTEKVTAEDWLVPADDFSSQPAPIRWIVKGWLQENSLIMIHGPSGGGKTFVLLEWLLTVASGCTTWHDKRVKPGPVVYLAGEGHEGLRGRVAGWKAARQADRLAMWISRSGCDLDTPAGYAKVASELRKLPVKPSIIAVDTLHRFLSGDENSAQDARAMLDACGTLMREFGCSVVLVHHTGVSDEAQHRARGSSAWRGALDVEISVAPAKGEQPMEIVQRKSKDAELAAPIYAHLVSQQIPGWLDEDGEPVTTAVVELADGPVVTPKIDRALHQARQQFAAGLMWCQQQKMLEKHPHGWYLARSCMRDYLIQDGKAERTAEQYVKDSAAGKMAHTLIAGGVISPHLHGWIVVDQDLVFELNTIAKSCI